MNGAFMVVSGLEGDFVLIQDGVEVRKDLRGIEPSSSVARTRNLDGPWNPKQGDAGDEGDDKSG